jgi:hypothetical protein
MMIVIKSMSEGLRQGSWNKSARRFIRAGFMPRKPLTLTEATTLPAAGVGWLLTRPGCPTASAGLGGAQGLALSFNN